MDSVSTGCSNGATSPGDSLCLNVSLVYQDLPSGLRAKQFLNHVLLDCQPPVESRLNLWKLEMFHVPEICEEAVTAASESALVLLSLRGDTGLDARAEQWLSRWVGRPGEDECALAVLIDCDMQRLDSVGQTLFRLKDLTRQSHVRLFAGFMPSAPLDGAHFQKTESNFEAPPPDVTTPKGPEIHREGGLNE